MVEGREKGCPLCDALTTELWLSSGWGFVILKTKNMKGHSKRCMVVLDGHQEKLNMYQKNQALFLLFDFIQRNHRDHDWTIMEPTHATIPEHWHLVASTLGEGTDQDLIADTERIEIRFKRRGMTDSRGCLQENDGGRLNNEQ